ncbi:MAG: beta-lactamase family protein [Alteromonadales bacterium]|nr:beta-lactamase family protein [Alteromonadales bacterium]
MFARITLFIVSIFIIPSAHSSNLNNLNNNFSALVATELNKYSIPGAAYAIIQNDNIVALETFGHIDKAKSRKVNANTVFRLASVSKTFASTITAMLSQEQQLNLSDPITKYVPNFSLATKGAAEKIQLKHILSHSSGLMPNAYDNMLHENWSLDKIINRFNRIAPICKPSQCYGYQNIAYGLLQPAIEASQPKSYASLLQDRIFSPLKMHNASVGISAFVNNQNAAQPHVLRKRVKSRKKDPQGKAVTRYMWRKVKVKEDFYKVATSAGVNASINDLAKWLIANLGHNADVLPPALITELTVPRIKTNKDLRRKFWRDHLTDAHYGYGWRIYQFKDTQIIYHSGWVAGFRADIGYSPQLGIGFAVLLNAESNAVSKISSEFWLRAYKLLGSS